MIGICITFLPTRINFNFYKNTASNFSLITFQVLLTHDLALGLPFMIFQDYQDPETY